jgi:hypothetical protein
MQLDYAGGRFLIGDEAANTLLDFASLLGKYETTDEVRLYTRSPSGEAGRSRFLIGPASQIVITTYSSDFEEPDNAEGIAWMRGKALALGTQLPPS